MNTLRCTIRQVNAHMQTNSFPQKHVHRTLEISIKCITDYFISLFVPFTMHKSIDCQSKVFALIGHFRKHHTIEYGIDWLRTEHIVLFLPTLPPSPIYNNQMRIKQCHSTELNSSSAAIIVLIFSLKNKRERQNEYMMYILHTLHWFPYDKTARLTSRWCTLYITNTFNAEAQSTL